MAAIRETLQIQDGFSATFNRFDALGARVAGTLDRVDKTLDRYADSQNAAARATQTHGDAARNANGSIGSLGSTIAKVAAALGGIAAVRGFVNLADDLSLMTTRLGNVNDGLQTTGELYDMIYAASQRSRGNFQQMAQTVSSLKAQTGDTFSSVREAVAFTELLNKQFKIAGTDATGIASTMYNLTQALSTGTLKGQDLNTVFANAPQLVQRIADYMGVPIGQVKDLASEGKISAQTVKNAVLGAADDINAQFDAMPMTFGDAMQKIKNVGVIALQPLAEMFAGAINSPEFDAAVNVVSNGIVMIAELGTRGFEQLGRAVRYVKENFDRIGPIIGVITGAIIAYNAAVGITNMIMGIHSVITSIAAVAQGVYAAGAAAAATGQSAFNAALAACPITWIIAAVIAAIAVVVALVLWFHNLADTGHTVFGDIAGVVMGTFSVIANILAIVANAFITAAEFIANAWNTGVYNIQMALYNFAVAAATQFNAVIDAADGAATALANAFIAGANQAIRGVNWLIDAINKIPGIDIGHMGEIGQIDSVISKRIDVGAIQAPTKADPVTFDRFETTSIGDAWSQGFEKGAAAGDNAQNSIGDKVSGILDTLKGTQDGIGDLGDSFSDVEIPDYSGSGGGTGGGGKKANVGTVDKVKEAKLSDEDVKLYRDLAERRYMANVELQTLAPNISVSIPESAAKNLTSEDVANKLKAMLIQQAAAHTSVAHAH